MKKSIISITMTLLALALASCGSSSSNGTSSIPSVGPSSGDSGITSESGSEGHVHEYGEWETVKEATCTESGSEKRTCSCGETETREIPALGHDFGEWTALIQATCTEGGTEVRECSRCHEQENRVVEAYGHDLDENTLKCSRCDYDETTEWTYNYSDITGFESDRHVSFKYVSAGHVCGTIHVMDANKNDYDPSLVTVALYDSESQPVTIGTVTNIYGQVSYTFTAEKGTYYLSVRTTSDFISGNSLITMMNCDSDHCDPDSNGVCDNCYTTYGIPGHNIITYDDCGTYETPEFEAGKQYAYKTYLPRGSYTLEAVDGAEFTCDWFDGSLHNVSDDHLLHNTYARAFSESEDGASPGYLSIEMETGGKLRLVNNAFLRYISYESGCEGVSGILMNDVDDFEAEFSGKTYKLINKTDEVRNVTLSGKVLDKNGNEITSATAGTTVIITGDWAGIDADLLKAGVIAYR